MNANDYSGVTHELRSPRGMKIQPVGRGQQVDTYFQSSRGAREHIIVYLLLLLLLWRLREYSVTGKDIDSCARSKRGS